MSTQARCPSIGLLLATTEVPFDLAEIKLAPPSIRPGTVAKEDVIARLSTAREPLATVVAPAGYGKTTLLARWAQADPRPFAWVPLDARDGDPVVLLRYIAAAIHRVEPVRPRCSTRCPAQGHPPGRSASRVSGARWPHASVPWSRARRSAPVANPSCLDVLAELVQYVPAGSQIAIASREEPALPLARWRQTGMVQEIGVGGPPAGRAGGAMLLEAAGVELDAASCPTDRADGGLAGGPVPGSAVDADGGGRPGGCRRVHRRRPVRVRVLPRRASLAAPAAEATFLKHTSMLERMSGGLCDAVLQTTGSAHTLDALERANGFVVPLDRRASGIATTTCSASSCGRSSSERAGGGGRAEPRAMAWCIANDLTEEAVGYGQAAGEPSTVADLVEALSPAALLRRPDADRGGVVRVVR